MRFCFESWVRTFFSSTFWVPTILSKPYFKFFFSCLILGCMYMFKCKVTFLKSLIFIILIIKKPVNQFTKQISWLISLWWELNDKWLRLAGQIAHITTVLVSYYFVILIEYVLKLMSMFFLCIYILWFEIIKIHQVLSFEW